MAHEKRTEPEPGVILELRRRRSRQVDFSGHCFREMRNRERECYRGKEGEEGTEGEHSPDFLRVLLGIQLNIDQHL